jgi:hypothetical protein
MSLQGFGYDDVVNQFEKRYNFWRVWDELAWKVEKLVQLS